MEHSTSIGDGDYDVYVYHRSGVCYYVGHTTNLDARHNGHRIDGDACFHQRLVMLNMTVDDLQMQLVAPGFPTKKEAIAYETALSRRLRADGHPILGKYDGATSAVSRKGIGKTRWASPATEAALIAYVRQHSDAILPDIAEHFGSPQSTVAGTLHRLGWYRVSRWGDWTYHPERHMHHLRQHHEEVAKLVSLLEEDENMTIAEMSRRMGLSRTRIGTLLRHASPWRSK